MQRNDHSSDLERIAARTGQSPLVVLELFLERASIREHLGGLSRELAEAAAVGDTAEALGLVRECAARPVDATDVNVQPDGFCKPSAVGEP